MRASPLSPPLFQAASKALIASSYCFFRLHRLRSLPVTSLRFFSCSAVGAGGSAGLDGAAPDLRPAYQTPVLTIRHHRDARWVGIRIFQMGCHHLQRALTVSPSLRDPAAAASFVSESFSFIRRRYCLVFTAGEVSHRI